MFRKVKSIRLWHCIAVMVRLGLGIMFLWSAMPKLAQPYLFLVNVYGYEMVGPKVGILAAMIIPFLEFFVGVCLLGSVFVSGSLLISLGLMAFFTYAHAFVLYHGLSVDCGCFSASSESLISYESLIRNLVILLFCLLAFMYYLLYTGQEHEGSSKNLSSAKRVPC